MSPHSTSPKIRRRAWIGALGLGAVVSVATPAHAVEPPDGWEPFAAHSVTLKEANGKVSRWHSESGEEAHGTYWAPRYDKKTSLGGKAQGGPAAALDNQGRAHVFVIGVDGAIHLTRESIAASPSSFVKGWTSLGGVCTSNPTAFRNSYALRMEVFCRGTDGAVHTQYQVTPGGAWSGWNYLGGVLISRVTSENHGTKGGAKVSGYGTDGKSYVKTRDGADTAWGEWLPK